MIEVSLDRAAMKPAPSPFTEHLFNSCRLLDWLAELPQEVQPQPRAGSEEGAAAKAPLRAGYLGHVTQIANKVQDTAGRQVSSSSAPGPRDSSKFTSPCTSSHAAAVHPAASLIAPIFAAPSLQPLGRMLLFSKPLRPAAALVRGTPLPSVRALLLTPFTAAAAAQAAIEELVKSCSAWEAYVNDTLQKRNQLENVGSWACGRPEAVHAMDDNDDDYTNDMEFEFSSQPLYHRYGVDDDDDDGDVEARGDGISGKDFTWVQGGQVRAGAAAAWVGGCWCLQPISR